MKYRPEHHRPSLRTAAVAGLVLAVVVLASLPARGAGTRAGAGAGDVVSSEIARVEGLATFAELLDRSGAGRVVSEVATPRDRARRWVALFAFTDEAWADSIGAADGPAAARAMLERDADLMERLLLGHAVEIDPGDVAGRDERAGFGARADDRMREFLLERSTPRTLAGGRIPVVRNRRGAARVVGSYVLSSSAVVVYAIDNVRAATAVRKAFLQAKKAFHEARQEADAIKKGDEEPVDDAVSFFDGEA